MRRLLLLSALLAVCLTPLPAAAGDDLRLAQNQCAHRVGPFATQQTAWLRWQQARAAGYSVSNGVVPCWENYTRGYCFNVFTC